LGATQETIRERFAALAGRPDPAIDLFEGALLIAAERYPGLDFEGYRRELDAQAEALRPSLGAATSDAERAAALVEGLHLALGYIGNQVAYYDPRNSFLNEVIDRRTGIPITLSVVAIELGRRLGLAVEGVGFPGHFLARCEGVLIDPFFGRLATRGDCEERLREVAGGEAVVEARFLERAGAREILSRMLANLKAIHLRAEELEPCLACCERLLLLRPDAPEELRDRGLVYARLECFGAAREDLERFLVLAPDDPTAEAVRRELEGVRRRARSIH
jgi:regulator of sirC expression with transglutaminase-like and TPR domain